jgi:hypothetical protein
MKMAIPFLKLLMTGIVLGLLATGVAVGVSTLDDEQITGMIENPEEKGMWVSAYVFALNSITPAHNVFGDVWIPNPDVTDVIGIALFIVLALVIAFFIPALQQNAILKWLFVIMFAIFGWLIWKLIMFWLFYHSATKLGIADPRSIFDTMVVAEKDLAIPLLLTGVFTTIGTTLSVFGKKWFG